MNRRKTKRGLSYLAVGEKGSVADTLEKLRRIIKASHMMGKSYSEIENLIIDQMEEELSAKVICRNA
jgi:hypothetical protein